jgi:hypothetical protein
MSELQTPEKSRFFVDESGDLVFFNKRGKPVKLGETGASRFFLIGAVRINGDIDTIIDHFTALRNELMNNPFCKHIPSIRETGIEFHAKNDSSIVKNEVFKLLSEIDASVSVVVRRKELILEQAVKTYKMTGVKHTINEKEIYHNMVSHLFRTLSDDEDCHIIFSERGKTFNDRSLAVALQKARNPKAGIHTASTLIEKKLSKEHIGLQIIDYFLWTIWQIYERDNIEYFDLLWDKYHVIMDIDDTRTSEHGIFYSKNNRISLDKIKMRK